MIPFARWPDRRTGGRREHVVERTGLFLFYIDDRVVDHLVFVTDRLIAFLGDEILDAIVGSGRNPPFPLQVKVVEFVRGDDVATANTRHLLEDPVLDYPPFVRKAVLLEAAPSIRRFAIKEQTPACGSF